MLMHKKVEKTYEKCNFVKNAVDATIGRLEIKEGKVLYVVSCKGAHVGGISDKALHITVLIQQYDDVTCLLTAVIGVNSDCEPYVNTYYKVDELFDDGSAI